MFNIADSIFLIFQVATDCDQLVYVTYTSNNCPQTIKLLENIDIFWNSFENVQEKENVLFLGPSRAAQKHPSHPGFLNFGFVQNPTVRIVTSTSPKWKKKFDYR